MTHHVVCHDCEFEEVVIGAFQMEALLQDHREETGHNVEQDIVDDGRLMTDVGAVTWTDLTGSKRDLLKAIQRLDNDGETTYGLAIKRELQRLYGEEINHGRLYPNLEDLVDAGLLEKGELDKRTNSYKLTTEAESMLGGE